MELLARSYFGSAQLTRAEAALTRLVELAPANAWARRALARTLERQSRPADAAVHHRVADALGAARYRPAPVDRLSVGPPTRWAGRPRRSGVRGGEAHELDARRTLAL